MAKPLFPEMKHRKATSDLTLSVTRSSINPSILTSPRPAPSAPPGDQPRYRSGCSCTIPSDPAPCRVFACTVMRKQTRCLSFLPAMKDISESRWNCASISSKYRARGKSQGRLPIDSTRTNTRLCIALTSVFEQLTLERYLIVLNDFPDA